MIYAIFSVIALIYGVMGYLLLNNIILGILIFAVFEVVLLFLVRPMVGDYVVKTRRRHECYQFVYSFMVSLSSLNSVDGAYYSAIEGVTGEEKDITDSIDQYQAREKIQYLANYFHQDYYKMFLSIFHIYEEQGGDVLDLAGPLLVEVAEVEKVENQKDKVKMNNLVQFLTLWALSAIILLSIRFGLSMFYEELSNSIIYILLTVSYFVLVIGSSLFFTMNITGEKLKFEWRKRNANKTK